MNPETRTTDLYIGDKRLLCLSCRDDAYRPDTVTGRRQALRCTGCHLVMGHCKCPDLRVLNDRLRAAVAEGDRHREALCERIHPTMDGYCPACGGGCLIGFATPTPARAALTAVQHTEEEEPDA